MAKALVVGLGISGLAAVKLLRARGFAVHGVDRKIDPSLAGISCSSESDPIDVTAFDLVVVSPGVPPTHPIYQQAIQKGVELIGEAELSFRHMKQPCIAITGTNGKTTVTLLTEHVLKSAGIAVRALGNVGDPLAAYAIDANPKEVLVIELSSYQLETMSLSPRFDSGVILNITPDHLDRYSGMEEYAAAKCRLQQCMKKESPFYVHKEILREYPSLIDQGGVTTYGETSQAALWTDKTAIFRGEKVEALLPADYKNKGIHESENALAVWALCRPWNVSPEIFLEALKTFKKPSHRIEHVTDIDGVAYYDDSKGTNLDAVIQAVKTMQGAVILIAGGVDKGASYLPWVDHFKGKVKQIIVIGQAAEKIFRELGFAFTIKKANSLQEAVKQAATDAVAGDSVLLSPGCSSFDMFRDYKERGEVFKQAVHHLLEERKNI